MSRDFYRFKRAQLESLSALKGASSWYAVLDSRDEPLFACHVVGSCLGGTTTSHRSCEDEEVLFRLEPKRKLLNLTYFVGEGVVSNLVAREDAIVEDEPVHTANEKASEAPCPIDPNRGRGHVQGGPVATEPSLKSTERPVPDATQYRNDAYA